MSPRHIHGLSFVILLTKRKEEMWDEKGGIDPEQEMELADLVGLALLVSTIDEALSAHGPSLIWWAQSKKGRG